MESRKVVHSWDFDGMLASTAYLTKMRELVIQAASQDRCLTMDDYRELAKHIIQQYKGEFFDKEFQDRQAQHTVAVGTNRQYREQDMKDGFLKGRENPTCTLSAFPFFVALTEELRDQYQLDIALDKTLLEDFNLGLKPGTIFDDEVSVYTNLDIDFMKKMALAMQTGDPNKGPSYKDFQVELAAKRKIKTDLVSPQFDDANKFLILLYQMHAMADQGVSDYLFRDDKGMLLKKLQEYFLVNPHLVPSNMRLDIDQFLPHDAELRRDPSADGIIGGFKKQKLPTGDGLIDSNPQQTYFTLYEDMQSGKYSLPGEHFESMGEKVRKVWVLNMIELSKQIAVAYEKEESKKLKSNRSNAPTIAALIKSLNDFDKNKNSIEQYEKVVNEFQRYFHGQLNKWQNKKSFVGGRPNMHKTIDDYVTHLNSSQSDHHYARLLGLAYLKCLESAGGFGRMPNRDFDSLKKIKCPANYADDFRPSIFNRDVSREFVMRAKHEG